MAVESAQQVEQAPEVPVKRWKFSVDDYYRLDEIDVFPPDARVELVDGDVIDMPRPSPKRAATMTRLNELFFRRLPNCVSTRIRCAVRLSRWSEPVPDASVVHRRADHYSAAHPTASDAVCVIEVGDETTLTFDRGQKAAMYGQAGITDYWIVDVVHRQVLVHRDPKDGVYQSVLTFSREATLTFLAFPELSIPVSDILG